jgi:hypothetical protein
MRKKFFHSNWLFWVFSLPVVIMLLVLTVFGSRILINPTRTEITPCGEIVMFRNYPLVDILGVRYPIVRYSTTITGLTPGTNNGYPCSETNKWRYNQDLGRGFNRWDIGHYATECMKDPVGFTFESTFVGYLFDAIPLRPITVEKVIILRGTPWDLCPFRNTE